MFRQLLAATLCALLVAPAHAGESTLPRTSSIPNLTYDAETLPETRVWGSNDKILLHFRAVEQLSEKQHWGCGKCSWKNVVGSVVTYDYDAFGNLIHSTGTTPNNYLFAGEQFDPDLNLYFNRARYLNVSTGRFWSMDDYEGVDREPFSLHKYLYVSSNPVGMVDPSGNDGLIDLSAAQGILEELAGTLNTITDTLQTINRVRGTVDLVANIWQVVNTLATGGASSLLVGLPTFDQLAKGIDIEAALSSLAQNGARALGLAALQPIMLEKVVEYFNAKDPAFTVYMPLPSPSILIGTPLKVKGIPVKLFFGGGANQGGRLLGIGMLKNQSFRDPNLQIFRMDYHEFHFPPGSLGGPNDLVPPWTDGPFHYHIPVPN